MTEIIPVIRWTATELFKLLTARIQDRKERFEKIHEPLMKTMTTIHLDYRKMFDTVLSLLPIHEVNDSVESIFVLTTANELKERASLESFNEFVRTELNSEIYKTNVNVVKAIFKEDRRNNDYLRINAREESKKILELSVNPYEKRFLWSVLNYFFQDKIPFTDWQSEDRVIEYTIRNGYDDMIATPSYLVSLAFEESNAQEISKKAKEVTFSMSRHYEHIACRFYELKSQTY